MQLNHNLQTTYASKAINIHNRLKKLRKRGNRNGSTFGHCLIPRPRELETKILDSININLGGSTHMLHISC
jgi:hypothetical protein